MIFFKANSLSSRARKKRKEKNSWKGFGQFPGLHTLQPGSKKERKKRRREIKERVIMTRGQLRLFWHQKKKKYEMGNSCHWKLARKKVENDAVFRSRPIWRDTPVGRGGRKKEKKCWAWDHELSLSLSSLLFLCLSLLPPVLSSQHLENVKYKKWKKRKSIFLSSTLWLQVHSWVSACARKMIYCPPSLSTL